MLSVVVVFIALNNLQASGSRKTIQHCKGMLNIDSKALHTICVLCGIYLYCLTLQAREHCLQLLETAFSANFVKFFRDSASRLEAADYEPRICAIDDEYSIFQSQKLSMNYKAAIMRRVADIKKSTAAETLHPALQPKQPAGNEVCEKTEEVKPACTRVQFEKASSLLTGRNGFVRPTVSTGEFSTSEDEMKRDEKAMARIDCDVEECNSAKINDTHQDDLIKEDFIKPKIISATKHRGCSDINKNKSDGAEIRQDPAEVTSFGGLVEEFNPENSLAVKQECSFDERLSDKNLVKESNRRSKDPTKSKSSANVSRGQDIKKFLVPKSKTALEGESAKCNEHSSGNK